MGRGFESAIYRDRAHRSRAGFVSADAGKLSDHSTGVAGGDFFLGRLDHGDEIISALRDALQPL